MPHAHMCTHTCTYTWIKSHFSWHTQLARAWVNDKKYPNVLKYQWMTNMPTLPYVVCLQVFLACWGGSDIFPQCTGQPVETHILHTIVATIEGNKSNLFFFSPKNKISSWNIIFHCSLIKQSCMSQNAQQKKNYEVILETTNSACMHFRGKT